MTHSSAPHDFAVPFKRKPLSFLTKLSFGAGDLGTAITANLIVFFFLFFLTNVAGLNPALAGSVLMIGKAWDAINDPIIGLLSDRTRSRWGRRYPWMLLGAIPLGISFFLLWVVPRFAADPAAQQWSLFAYYVVSALLFHTFYTAVNLPYTALTPEITQDYNERTSLNSFRFTFSIGGSILSLILAQVIISVIPDPGQQYLVLGGICALFAVLPVYFCVWGTWKRVMVDQPASVADNSQSLPLSEQLRLAFGNRPFMFVIGIYLCSWLAVQNTAAIIPYFVVNWMQLPQSAFTQVALAVQGTALVMLFVWSAISKRVGKKAVYFMGMGIWILAQAGLFFLQRDQATLMYILAVLAGFGVSTAYLVPWSMIPDVIDLDELKTGQRREGLFYSFMVFLQKIGLALGLFLVGQVLQAAGFIQSVPGQPAPAQPESALLAIRLVMGPVPTVILIGGLILAYLYPITQEVHAQILLQLQERRQGSASEPEVEN